MISIYIVTYSLFYLHVVETTIMWYVVFRGQKPGVYDSWGVCSEYILGFSSVIYQSYSIRMQAEEAYAAFLEHQNKDRKTEDVTRKPEHITNMWCSKDWVILVQFIVIVVLWYKIM
jgi:viroplasmin and RNaseH domain-containing protein